MNELKDRTNLLKEKLGKACIPWLQSLVQNGNLLEEDAVQFFNGYISYIDTGKTSQASYLAHRKLYLASRGAYPLIMRSIYSYVFEEGIPTQPGTNQASYAEELASDGYLSFDGYFAKNNNLHEICQLLDKASQEIHRQEETNSFRVTLNENEVLSSKLLNNILADTFLMNIVREYLGSKPIIDLVTAWRLVPLENYSIQTLSHDALLYHIDMDRSLFLKLFVYLNDVDLGNGPHCYVPRTHMQQLPQSINQDRRYEESEIYSLNIQPNVICGKAGTVIIGDTHCLHKGCIPIERHRDIFQVEFAISLYGAAYDEKLVSSYPYSARDQVKQNP